MSNTNSDIFEREKALLQSFFKESLDLDWYDLRRTYTQFRLLAVDGIPVKSKIILDFYNEKAYMPMDSRRDYAGKLDVRIMGNLFPTKEDCIGSYEKKFSRNAFQDREHNKLSIVDVVREASSYKFEKHSEHSGYLRKVDDPDYAQRKCMDHLGRKRPPCREEVEDYLHRNGYPQPDSDWVDEFISCSDKSREEQFWEAVLNDYDLCDFDRWQHFQDVIHTECSWKGFLSIMNTLWEEDIEILELGGPQQNWPNQEKAPLSEQIQSATDRSVISFPAKENVPEFDR